MTTASQPSLGTRIRRAREVKRWTQQQLADRIGVSRSAVNAWENDRTHPRSSIGALEEHLSVNLTEGSNVPIYVDPDEVAIWAMNRFSEDERRRLIAHLREIRGAGH